MQSMARTACVRVISGCDPWLPKLEVFGGIDAKSWRRLWGAADAGLRAPQAHQGRWRTQGPVGDEGRAAAAELDHLERGVT